MSTRHEDQIRSAELLETLLGFEMFSTKLDTERCQGMTLIHILALNDHVEAIKKIVEHGADVNVGLTINRNVDGSTALSIVKERLRGEDFPLSIKAGAESR